MRRKLLAILICALSFLPLQRTCSAQEPSPELSGVALSAVTVRDLPGGGYSVEFGMDGSRAQNCEPVIDVEKSSAKTVEYFFTCLAFSDDAFWINLNPGQPETIADRGLSRTDVGKILLAADLRLKKDTSALTNPRTATGRVYWDRLYAKADELGVRDVPVVNRVYIVPGDAAVSESAGGISIASTRLSVRLGSEYGADGPSGDPRMQELQSYANSLMHELILPQLEEKINSSYAYSELRQAYRAMIAARWFRDSFNTSFSEGAVIPDLVSDLQYGSDEVYGDYLESLKAGEYSLSETSGADKLEMFMGLITRRYSSGGIDLRKIIIRAEASSLAQAARGTVRFFLSFAFNRKDARPLMSSKHSLAMSFPTIERERIEAGAGIAPAPVGRAIEQAVSSARNVLSGL
ncbi:MAG: hypothetical protein ACM3OC_00325 [Deltaproteobacteria bacterium]